MTDRAFRFGVVATPESSDQWLGAARRVAELGYSTLLMPDGIQLPATLPSLAIAAAAAPGLRVGSFVMATPLHPPRLLAWEAHSLRRLTGGRFELGIGTGLPVVAEQQAVELFGGEPLSGAERLGRLRDTVARLRELDGPDRTPVLIAARGPRALALAAAVADIVTVAAGPLASGEEVGAQVDRLLAAAGPRAGEIELATNLFVVGDQVPPWVQQFLRVDPAALYQARSLAVLRGSTQEMVDELERRRERFGVSYITVQSAFLEALAPVVERLSGR